MLTRNKSLTILCGIFFLYADCLLSVPLITNLISNVGPKAGGNTIQIIGEDFTDISSVEFGPYPAVNYQVISSQQINVIVPIGSTGNVVIKVTGATGTSVNTPEAIYTYQGNWTGYTTNNFANTVDVLDVPVNADGSVINTISAGLNAPLTLAINPEATRAYICNYVAAGSISILDLATNTVIGTIPGLARPAVIAITPDGTKAYVTNQTIPGGVTVIDLATNSIITTILSGIENRPFGIAIAPDGKKAYVANLNNGAGTTVSVIDTTTNIVINTISGLSGPNCIAITPDGKKAYVTSLTNGNVYIIDLNTETVLASLPIGDLLEGVSITPDGSKALVSDLGTNIVTIIDTATDLVIDSAVVTTSSFVSPNTTGITPDSKKAYATVPNVQSTIVPINLTTIPAIVDAPVNVGNGVYGVYITPDQAPVASFIATKDASGQTVQFDASSSRSPVGTIANYAWDFGDGTTVTTTNPVTSHSYSSLGSYSVTLTVTNSIGTSTTQVFTGQTLSRNGNLNARRTQTVNLQPISTLFPPQHLRGKQIRDQFASQTDFINIVTWDAPTTGETPQFYEIYRDPSLTHLAAQIPANRPFIFRDHNRRKNKTYFYYIVSINAAGTRSEPAQLKVKPNHH